MKMHRYFYPDGNFELLYLCDYYPVDMYKQEFYNNHCNRLLDFRQNLDDSLDYIRGYLYNDPYWDKLTKELEGEDVHLYAFPSCTIDNYRSGLYPLVEVSPDTNCWLALLYFAPLEWMISPTPSPSISPI